MEKYFEVIDTKSKEYPRFNSLGTQLTVRFRAPQSDEPVNHFVDSVNALFEYALENAMPSDMVGLTVRNEENQSDKPIGFSFRRKDQVSGDVIWSVFEKVSQSNARFNAMDKLVVDVQVVKMPVGYGRTHRALNTKGQPMSVISHLKTIIVTVKSEKNCLAH